MLKSILGPLSLYNVLGNFVLLIFFSNLTFSKNTFRNTYMIGMSNSLDTQIRTQCCVQNACKGYEQTTKVATHANLAKQEKIIRDETIFARYMCS